MVDFLVIINLIILECLLSVDNAAVLAVMVKVLPTKEQQNKALKYGILGAYFFRGICLVFVSLLSQLVWLKILGGLFLLYLTYKHFTQEEEENKREVKFIPMLGLFWSTVLYVELADLAFSIDNVFAAVALSPKMWVVIVGVFIGIAAMRFIAQWFVNMIEKYPSLNTSAFIVIGILGFKLVISGIVDYIPSMVRTKALLESHNTDMFMSALTLVVFLAPIFIEKHKQA